MTHSPVVNAAWPASEESQPWADAQRQKNRSVSRPSRNAEARCGNGASALARHFGSTTQRNPSCRSLSRRVGAGKSGVGPGVKAPGRLQRRLAIECGRNVRPAEALMALGNLFGVFAFPEPADRALHAIGDARGNDFSRVVPSQHHCADGGRLGIVKMTQGDIRPAREHLDAAGQDVDDRSRGWPPARR